MVHIFSNLSFDSGGSIAIRCLSMNKNINFDRLSKNRISLAKTFNKGTSIIGISTIALIVIVVLCLSSVYSISAEVPQLTYSKPKQFNLDVTYAYVGQGPPNATFTDSKGIILSPASQYPSAVYLNITCPSIENVECDAILEVFNVKIASDKGPDENFAYFVGTNYNPSFSDEELNTLTMHIYDLIDLEKVDGVTGNFRFNWTKGESILSTKVGSFGIYTNYVNDLGLWNAGKPNTISVTVHRIGYVTMTNGISSVQPDLISDNNKAQVQLQEHNNGFLKNTIVPTDELSQRDQFQPLKSK